jgi:hypothetical protein
MSGNIDGERLTTDDLAAIRDACNEARESGAQHMTVAISDDRIVYLELGADGKGHLMVARL